MGYKDTLSKFVDNSGFELVSNSTNDIVVETAAGGLPCITIMAALAHISEKVIF